MSTETNNENEKPPPSPNGRLSWLKPKQSDKRDSASYISSGDAPLDVRAVAPVEDDLKPVSFFGLFRFVSAPTPFYLHFLILSYPGSPLAQSSSSMVLL